MFYYVNKIVGGLLNPLTFGLLLVVAGACLLRFRKLAGTLFAVAVAWLWIWSTPALSRATGLALERPWLDAQGRIPTVETVAPADLIVLLGGGMGATTNHASYAEMFSGADRVWQAARLYKAGKAPRIFLSGIKSRESTLPLLVDFGVPAASVLIENDSLNTEQNVKFVSALLAKEPASARRVILVTSAYHMRRSLLMFAKYAPELTVTPSPGDFETMADMDDPLTFGAFFPDAGALMRNTVHTKEIVGYWGYRLLRK